MYWLLILLLIFSAGGLAWRLAYVVEWRTDNPGRHAAGHVSQMSRDVTDPDTDVFPAIRHDQPYEDECDPGLVRLASAVRRWTEYQQG